MGLMAAVLVFALLSCDEGISTNPDGGSGSDAQGVGDDTGDKDGSVTIYDGSGGQDATTGGDEYHSDGGDTGDGGEVCDGDVYWLCVTGSGGNCCGDAGLKPRCYDGVPVCPQGMIPEYECNTYCDVGQPWPDAGYDGGDVGQDVDGAAHDGGTDIGSGEDVETDGGLDDGSSDSGADDGFDGGTADTGIVVQCGPSPSGKGGVMCDVPVGPFQMGCNEAVDTECADNEKPYHVVTVPAFKIDKYDVTTAEYKVCVDAGQCTAASTYPNNCNYGDVSGRGSYPINCIEWDQAKAYCQWASKRLPTEAEWEKAARGTDGRKYPWGNSGLDCDHAVMSANGCASWGTAQVGSKPAGISPYGTLDMIGNVWQFVEDDWHDSYNGAPADGRAWVSSPRGTSRVSRGGSWYSSSADSFRASRRGICSPDHGDEFTGFRCAWGSDVVCTPNCVDKCGGPDDCGGTCPSGGAWYDSSSNLTWQVCAASSEMSWQAAIAYCALLGGAWRLPTISELRSLIRGNSFTQTGGSCHVTDSCRGSGCCNADCQGNAYMSGPDYGCYRPGQIDGDCTSFCWSVTSVSDYPAKAWGVYFSNGGVEDYEKAFTASVRCVSTGP
jgi:formylglycine-generating enzyme required for sulfatase activity